jgi:hypothetical protein
MAEVIVTINLAADDTVGAMWRHVCSCRLDRPFRCRLLGDPLRLIRRNRSSPGGIDLLGLPPALTLGYGFRARTFAAPVDVKSVATVEHDGASRFHHRRQPVQPVHQIAVPVQHDWYPGISPPPCAHEFCKLVNFVLVNGVTPRRYRAVCNPLPGQFRTDGDTLDGSHGDQLSLWKAFAKAFLYAGK